MTDNNNLDSQIQIIYESDDYVVVNKPKNIHIDGEYPVTIEKYVQGFAGVRPKLVHQLDFPTSGVMILALNRKAAGRAASQFQQRATKKYYLAVVHGEVKTCTTIISPIMDDIDDPKKFKMKIDPQGLAAETLVFPLLFNYEKKMTLLLLKPLTGRRHQLRLHLFSIGHGIVNDATYQTDAQVVQSQDRLQLHAFALFNAAIGVWLFASATDELGLFGFNGNYLCEEIKGGKYDALSQH